ncbi:MAG: glucuronate isomerase [Enterobacteriaceae bacterium]|jgi:glucuronate isomerase|nr:glucuronate isomerase [Enterobacteriaceae bacterium]
MSFINNSFMITNECGLQLYNNIAKKLPIIDYHCHLDAKEIYENKHFQHISHLWLAGDHYKWRAMRANGIPENKITGNASSDEKFQAWAETVESCFGNPLYHWTHLELTKYFSVTETLNSKNWQSIMNRCNDLLQRDDFTPRALIERSDVEVICTTDNPLDDLRYHKLLQADNFKTKVLPTFRPDDVFDTEPTRFNLFINKLEEITQIKIKNLSDFHQALASRIAYFHDVGCRISDHGPVEIQYQPLSAEQNNLLFQKILSNTALSDEESRSWNSAILVALAAMYKKHNWAMQLHFGAIRNNNTVKYQSIGINSGFDSIADQTHLAANLNGLLDAMLQNNGLPKTILYNLNASYNDVVATTIANFQSGDEGIKSPMQFGSGWWFNDTRQGMLNQLTTLSEQGVLANFVGMLTDSRSFVSYTRHDYFRRILCNLIGDWVEKGEVPNDQDILQTMITNICVGNARRYFGF